MHNEIASQAPSNYRPTLRQQIVCRLKESELIQSELIAALAMLDQSPEFEKIHDTITRLNIKGIY